MTTAMQHRRLTEHYRDQAIANGDMVDNFSEAISLAQVHATLYQGDMLRAQVLAIIGGRDAEVAQILEPYNPEQPLPRDVAEGIEDGAGGDDWTPSYPPSGDDVHSEAFDG